LECPIGDLKRRPASEAGIHVVPPFKLVSLAYLPAKKHDPTIPERRKIYQTSLEVL
jgi:hypothetical protein